MSYDVYATDELDHGVLTHVILENGLRLESRYKGEGGNAWFGVGWNDLETAEANYENARQGALKRIDEVKDRLAEMDGTTDVKKIRTVVHLGDRHLKLYTNVGPPTWWLPKAKVDRLKSGELALHFGWLRRAFGLWFERD